jgi:predicted nucleic-acid-binding Zn-ribbon protein
MSEVKKCPKCGREMRMGKLLARYNPIKHYDLVFESSEQQRKLLTEKKWLVAYACENCGYLESYLSKTGGLP